MSFTKGSNRIENPTQFQNLFCPIPQWYMENSWGKNGNQDIYENKLKIDENLDRYGNHGK